MAELLGSLLNIATLAFAVSSMLSVGFSYTVRELIEPLRNARLLIGALVANFVLVPLLAYVITQFLSLSEAREIGLFLVATAAGAPFLIKLTQAADGDLALAAGLLVLLLVVTIAYMPIVVPLIPVLFNSDSPRILGFPRFYWLQLAYILLGVATTRNVMRSGSALPRNSERTDIQAMIDLRPDGISSNRPDLVLRLLGRA